MMIEEKLNYIYKLNETYDPYRIANNSEINIIHIPLDSETYGLTIRNNRSSTIILNSTVDENLSEFVLCHELGHSFLHQSASTPFMRNFGAPSQIYKLEAEANRFAFRLLKHHYEELEYMSKDQIVSYFQLPKYFTHYI